MENLNRVVGQNLRLMYMGEVMVILGLLCSFVVRWFPIIGLILIPAVLLGFVTSVMGLVKLRRTQAYYQRALVILIIGLLVGFLSDDTTVFGNIVELISSMCSILMIYCVIQGSTYFLEQGGMHGVAALGSKAWRWQLISLALSICSGAAEIVLVAAHHLQSTDFMTQLIAVIGVISLVVSLVAGIVYLNFLKQSSESLIRCL